MSKMTRIVLVRFATRVFRKTVVREAAFNPSEVDESLLRSILEEHIPGKCLDNTSDG